MAIKYIRGKYSGKNFQSLRYTSAYMYVRGSEGVRELSGMVVTKGKEKMLA
jgi:hypothetical protein